MSLMLLDKVGALLTGGVARSYLCVFAEFAESQRVQFEENGQQQSQFLNADAIYLASYACLCVAIRPEITKV